MQVIYRITSVASSNPSPVFQDNKNRLNELCLDQFLFAFWETKPTITFIADFCSCIRMIEDCCSRFRYTFNIIESEVGQNQTMLDSYAQACKLDDYVLFNECDHLWLPGSGPIMLEAIKKLGLVSGYDHPDFYSRFDIHPKETEVTLVANHHFRKAARNVMSWGCHSNLVKDNLDILNHHGYLDDGIWLDLRERGHQLWTALPALSTHMVESCLSPNIDWKEMWKTLT